MYVLLAFTWLKYLPHPELRLGRGEPTEQTEGKTLLETPLQLGSGAPGRYRGRFAATAHLLRSVVPRSLCFGRLDRRTSTSHSAYRYFRRRAGLSRRGRFLPEHLHHGAR